MKKKKNNNNKVLMPEIDNSLEKYVDMPLFQKKVDEANRVLDKVGLPKEKKKNK